MTSGNGSGNNHGSGPGGKFSQYPRSAQLAIIIGVACVLYGVWKLLGLVLGGGWLDPVLRLIRTVFSFAWPLALIAAGIYLVWAVQHGRFAGAGAVGHGRVFGRSVTDKRLAGVCGGIATYFNVDATVVRVLAVVLFVVAPPVTVIIYILMAVLIPPA